MALSKKAACAASSRKATRYFRSSLLQPKPPALANTSQIANRKSKMRNVVLLGSTGSIGTSTIKVAIDLPDRIRLLGLAAGNNVESLLEQNRLHRPQRISTPTPP